MADSFNSTYLNSWQQKEKAKADALVAEDEQWLKQNAPAPKPAPAAPAPAPQKKTTSFTEGLTDTVRMAAHGVTNFAQSATDLANAAANVVSENLFGYHFQAPRMADKLEEIGISKPKTVGGQIGSGLIQWAIPYAGTAKALQAATAVPKMAKAAAAGVSADFLAFGPEEKRLSNMLVDLGDKYPVLKNPVTEYLAASPDDSQAEGRMKNVLEGAGIGVAAEGLFKLLKATHGYFSAKGAENGMNAAQVVAEAHAAHQEDLTAHAMDTSKAPDMALADQINTLTGVKRNGPSKFQKYMDMKAAVADSEAAAKPKGLELAPEGAPAATPSVDPQATAEGILAKSPREMKLTEEDWLKFNQGAPVEPKEVSFPDSWKLVEKDPNPRKVFLDPQDGHLAVSHGGEPHQLDLDLAFPKAVESAEKTPADVSVLEGYKKLQDDLLANVPDTAKAAEPAASDLEERIAKAQARVDALQAEGRDSETAQKVLDNLLKKKDGGLFEKGSALSAKEAEAMAPKDALIGAITANNERLSRALGRQQGGFITPSMLANLAAAQVGGITGFLSAEDDATFAERLSLAGMGALAGYGVKVGLGKLGSGATKVLGPAERAVVESPHPVAQELAQSHLANIAPLPAAAKPQPVIRRGGIARLAEAVKNGNLDEVAKEAKDDAFNFSRIDTDEDVKELFNATEAAFQQEIDTARGGAHVSFDQIKEMAEMTGGGMKSLEALYQGTDGLASKFYAHRAMLAASAEKVMELAKLAREGGSFDILAANKQLRLHAVIQAKVNGIQTEIARAMSAMRIHANSADFAVNEANALVDSLGGHTAQIKFFSDLADIQSKEGFNQAVRLASTARTRSALVESITMGKLWSPVTHVANMTGNLLVAIGTVAERAGSVAVGKVLRNTTDAVTTGEVKAQLFGMLGGLYDALKITKQGRDALMDAGKEALSGNFKEAAGIIGNASDEFGSAYAAGLLGAPSGRSSLHTSMERNMESMGAISAKNFNLNPDEFFGKAVDALGTLTRIPGHALAFSDEIFWSLQYRGELRAQAYRKALNEGLEGEHLVSRVADLVSNPTPDIRGFAIKAAEDGTFTAPLGEHGQAFMNLVDKTNVGALPVGRIIVPYVKTPTNILKYAFERSPLAPLSSQVREELMAGGARRDLAVSKIAAGSSLLMAATALTSGMDIDGAHVQLIGGGDLKKSAENLGGIQPYSLKVGDKYYAFNRLDPLGMFLGLAADFKDIAGHIDESKMSELAAAAALSISRNLTSKTYLKGISDFTDAFAEASKGNVGAFDKYLMNQGAGMLPFSSAFNTARKEADPITRDVWDMMDAVKNKIPGFSQDVPPVVNALGEEVQLKGGLGPDIMSPVMTSEATSDPIAHEIARLNIDLQKPPKALSPAPGAPAIDLDKWQYHKLSKLAGENFKASMQELIQSDAYKGLTEGNDEFLDGKEKVIKGLYSKAKLKATMQLLQEDADLQKQWMETRQKASSALTGAPLQLPF